MTDPAVSYHGYRFPPEIISRAVWLHHRFCLSFRDTEDLLAQRALPRGSDSDVGRSVLRTPVVSSADRDGWATPGTWTNSS